MSTDLSAEFDQPKRRSRRHWHFALIIAAATGLNTARLMQSEPLQSANDRSRWTTVWSLVERGTYQIDEIRRRAGWDTIDLVRNDDGHFYSSKPPILSTLVAGAYWAVTNTLRWTLDAHLLATTRLLLALFNLIPSTVALVLLTSLVDRFAISDFTRYFVVLAAAMATLLQPFIVTLNNHTPAANSCLFALYALICILVEGRDAPWWYAMAGFWAAWTSCFELPAALFGAASFVLLARLNLRRTLIWFVPAALVPIAAFMVTNYLATGSWKPFYLSYGTELYEFYDEGVPSYWISPKGVDRATDGTLAYFLHCTIGHHGILSLTPIYLLTLGAWCNPRTWTESPLRVIHRFGCLLTAGVLAFYLTKTENYNYGGVSVALRWMLWLTPFWLLAMMSALDDWRPEWRGRTFCTLLLGFSAFSAWYPFQGPWHQPWLFDVMKLAGWIDYDAHPQVGPPFHTWIRELPPTDPKNPASNEPDPDYWIEFEGWTADGGLQRVRLADAGGRSIDGTTVRLINVQTNTVASDGAQVGGDQWTAAVDIDKFAAGLPVDQLIVLQASEGDLETMQLFLQGLPLPRAYQPDKQGRLRYVTSPLRAEKFQCELAAAQVRIDVAEHNASFHRRELWMTSDVPFGILAYETSIFDAGSRNLLARQRMLAVNSGRVEAFDPKRLRRP